MDQTALRIVALVLAGCLVAEQTFADGYRAALVHPLHAPESARSLWRSQALAARNVSAEFQPHAAAMDDVPVRCLDVVRPAGRFRTSGYSLFPLKLPAIAKSAAFLLALRTVLPAAELTSGQPDQSWILIPVIVLGLTVGTLFIGLLKVFRSPPEQRAPVAPKAALGRGTWRRLWPWIGLVVGLPLATAVIDERIGGSLPDDPMAKLRQIRDGWKKDPDPQKLAAGLRELARQTPGPHPDLMLADYLTWSLRLSYDGDRARLDKDQVVRAVCDVLVACQWSAAMYRVWPEVFYNAQRATSITVRHAFLSLARMGDDGKPLMAAMIPTALHPDGPELRPADLRRLHRFLTVLMARYRNQNDTEAAWDALLGETSRLPADCSVRALQVLAKIPSPNRTVVNHHVQRLLWLRTTPDVKARRQIHEAAVDLLTAIAKRNRNWDDSLQGAWLAVLGEFGGVSVEPVLEALRAMRKNLDVPDYWIAAEARRLLKQEWPPEESSDATIRVWAALAEIWAASPRFYYELGQALDEVGTRAEMEMHLGAERDRHIESFQNALDRLKPYEAQNVIRLVRAVVTVSPSVILVPAGMAPLTRDEIGRYLDLLSPDGDEQLLVEMESLKGDYRRVEHWIQEKAPNYIGRHLLFVFNWVLTGLALDAARDEQRSARLLDAVQFVTDQLGLLDRPVGSSLDHQSDIAPTPAEFSTVSAEAIDQLAAQIKKTKRARGNAMMRLVNGVLKGDPNLLLDSTDPEAASGQPLSLQLALYLDLLARESQAESVRTKLMADPRWSQPAGELWAAKGPLFCDVPPLFGLNWLVTELAIRSSTVLAPAHLKQMRFASEQLGEWLQALRLNRWGNVPD
ncbi:MAG TPA: hypothetical protein VMU17_04615, partial [Elusimicrobiota bacterium]|nr:hypothetical protein [Elusimicrobiota bacterium]